MVVATGLDGHTHRCVTNTTSCSWNELQCGEEYTVVVRANDDNCTSLPSNSSVIYMSRLCNICLEKIINIMLVISEKIPNTFYKPS